MKKIFQAILFFAFISSNCYALSGKSSVANYAKKRIHHKIKYLGLSPVTYYIHPLTGNDANAGTSKGKPFKTLQQIEKLKLNPGDRILLAANQEYDGSLHLVNQQGNIQNPIEVNSVNWNDTANPAPAIINCRSWANGILIQDCSSVHISNIRITGNGFDVPKEASDMRCGVLVNNVYQPEMNDIRLDHLFIKDVYYENPGFVRNKNEVHSANGTQRYGWGIRINSLVAGHQIRNVQITNTYITDVSHTGIKLTGRNKNLKDVQILNNHVIATGGPGIQMSEVQDVYVANNVVDHSGSNNDSRKWGRGSGLWTWGSSDVLIEKNKFLHANGPGDSDGAHIDFNCENIIIQYNFSAYNAGGFCEILGNNYNAVYRYNISVNDGHRIKGEKGAFQEGKILWLSGYQGDKQKRKGPVNTYIYNNTIYTDASLHPKIAFDNTSKGVIIANNIFYLVNPFQVVQGDQYKPDVSAIAGVDNMELNQNLFLHSNSWPEEMTVKGSVSLFGNPDFTKPGGSQIQDYMPLNTSLIKHKGSKTAEWNIGNAKPAVSLKMDKDILGNPVSDHPSIGAIEPAAYSN